MFAYTKDNSSKRRLGVLVSALLGGILVLAACAPAAPASQPPESNQEQQPTPTDEPPETQPLPREPGKTPEPLPQEAVGPIVLPETPILGEVPDDLLAQIFQDLQQNQGRSPELAELLRAEAVTWPDGSLGCPEPGQMYTMALVDGYWVQIRVGDEIYDYRASQRGTFKLCTQDVGSPKPPSPGG